MTLDELYVSEWLKEFSGQVYTRSNTYIIKARSLSFYDSVICGSEWAVTETSGLERRTRITDNCLDKFVSKSKDVADTNRLQIIPWSSSFIALPSGRLCFVDEWHGYEQGQGLSLDSAFVICPSTFHQTLVKKLKLLHWPRVKMMLYEFSLPTVLIEIVENYIFTPVNFSTTKNILKSE